MVVRPWSEHRADLTRNAGNGYVTALNVAWSDIEEGELYPVIFTLDGQDYDAEARSMYLKDVPGADILFDLALKRTMALYTSAVDTCIERRDWRMTLDIYQGPDGTWKFAGNLQERRPMGKPSAPRPSPLW